MQHLFSIHVEDIALRTKLVTTGVATMAGGDVFEAGVFRVRGEREINYHIPPGENVRVLLTNVVIGVDQRLHVQPLLRVAGYGTR